MHDTSPLPDPSAYVGSARTEAARLWPSLVDDEELGRLLDAERQRGYNLAYRLLRCRDDAADAVQEASLRAVRAVRGGTAAPREPDRFGSWYLRIVSNVALDQLRAHARGSASPLGDLDQGLPTGDGNQPGPEVERREERGDVLRALLALPATQRAALTLREYQGLTYDEIGEQLGLNRAATTTLLFRARASFREAYEGVAGRSEPVGCPDLAPLISAMIDGELDADAWTSVERHLRVCRRCQRELRNVRRSRRLYAAIPLLAPPAGWYWAVGAGAATAQAAGAISGSAATVPSAGPAAVGAATALGLGPAALGAAIVPSIAPTLAVGAAPAAVSGIGGLAATIGGLVTGNLAAVALVAGVTVAVAASPLPEQFTAAEPQAPPTPVVSVPVTSPAPPGRRVAAAQPPSDEPTAGGLARERRENRALAGAQLAVGRARPVASSGAAGSPAGARARGPGAAGPADPPGWTDGKSAGAGQSTADRPGRLATGSPERSEADGPGRSREHVPPGSAEGGVPPGRSEHDTPPGAMPTGGSPPEWIAPPAQSGHGNVGAGPGEPPGPSRDSQADDAHDEGRSGSEPPGQVTPPVESEPTAQPKPVVRSRPAGESTLNEPPARLGAAPRGQSAPVPEPQTGQNRVRGAQAVSEPAPRPAAQPRRPAEQSGETPAASTKPEKKS